eukprot:3667359-Pyramimonas_sp.AAC.4
MSTYEIKRPDTILNMKVLVLFSLMVGGFMLGMIYTIVHMGDIHPGVGPSVREVEKETVRTEAPLSSA